MRVQRNAMVELLAECDVDEERLKTMKNRIVTDFSSIKSIVSKMSLLLPTKKTSQY